MKKNNIVKGLFLSITMATLAITTVFAGSTAGSEDDPIVTKSYVDAQIQSILETFSGDENLDISEDVLQSIVDSATDQVLENIDDKLDNINTSEDSNYVPVELSEDEVLFGGEGTEIILRSGSAKTVVYGSDGIVNATTGENLETNKSVPKNNILIVPREDGRGIIAEDDSTWCIVKGDYTVQ